MGAHSPKRRYMRAFIHEDPALVCNDELAYRFVLLLRPVSRFDPMRARSYDSLEELAAYLRKREFESGGFWPECVVDLDADPKHAVRGAYQADGTLGDPLPFREVESLLRERAEEYR